MKLKIYQSFPSLSGSSHVPHLLQFKILILGLDSNRAFPLQKKKKKAIIFPFAQTQDPDKKEGRKQNPLIIRGRKIEYQSEGSGWERRIEL